MLKTAVLIGYLVLAVGLGTSPATAGGLTLVYTANSHGHVKPCPTCGAAAAGGLARRAAVFADIRASQAGAGALFLAGPDEFSPDAEAAKDGAKPANLVAAYEALGYDFGCLTRAEEDWLAAAKLKAPRDFLPIGPVPRTMVLDKGGHKVALVVFPRAPEAGEVPEASRKAVVQAAADALAEADLVVGLSSWGLARDEAFLNADAPALDIVIGGGPGQGQVGKVVGKGRVLLVHAYARGMAVGRVDIPEMPARTSDWTWQPRRNVFPTTVLLGDAIPGDPEMAAILER